MSQHTQVRQLAVAGDTAQSSDRAETAHVTDDHSWLREIEITQIEPTADEAAAIERHAAAIERHNEAVERLARRGEVPTAGCSSLCEQHRGHVYVLCFGEPVHVGDSDVNVRNRMSEPIAHYVGYTGGVPIARIGRHGVMSRWCVAEILPGSPADEERMKFNGRCAFCGSGLHYWEESPYWRERYVPRMLARLAEVRLSRQADGRTAPT
jgi:hypothetical protein